MAKDLPLIKQKKTAIDSYHGLKNEGKTAKQAAVVLEFIKRNGASTDREVAQALSVAPGIVCARRNELMSAGLVKDTGLTRLDKETRKQVTLWAANENLELFHKKALSAQRKRAMIKQLCQAPGNRETPLAIAIMKILND